MRKRPKVFLVLAFALASIGTSLPVQVAWTYGHPVWEVVPILAKLAPMNWVVMTLAFVGAALALQASRALLAFAPLFLAAVAWNHWVIAQVGLNQSPAALFVATLAIGALLGLIRLPDAWAVIRNPRLRWWLTPPRREATVRAVVWPVMGGELVTETFDVSEGGAYLAWSLATPIFRSGSISRHLRSGSHCSLSLVIDDGRVLRCTAQVVRQAPARGKYPEGFAVRFIGLTRGQRELLGRFVSEARDREAAAPLARAA